MRIGGGHSAKLSIPRDTVVDIPGHGRNKINAAYAIGGAALTVQTIKQYLGIEIDHVFEVNFDNFPAPRRRDGRHRLHAAAASSRASTAASRTAASRCACRAGTTHIDGKQALALSRTRHNLCNPGERPHTRAPPAEGHQRDEVARALSPAGFIRLPFISWNAPKTIQTDMRGPALLGYAIGTALSGSATTEILKPSGGVTLPDGGAGLTVSDAEKQADVGASSTGSQSFFEDFDDEMIPTSWTRSSSPTTMTTTSSWPCPWPWTPSCPRRPWPSARSSRLRRRVP